MRKSEKYGDVQWKKTFVDSVEPKETKAMVIYFSQVKNANEKHNFDLERRKWRVTHFGVLFYMLEEEKWRF